MDGQPCAVDDEMDGFGRTAPVFQGRLQRAAAPGEGGVVWRWEP